MTARHVMQTAATGIAVGAGLAAVGYAGLVAFNRVRYGRHTIAPSPGDGSTLLDRFIPTPEVVEHCQIRIAAPADVVLATAKGLQLLNSGLVQAVFKLRAIALGGRPDSRLRPKPLLEQMQSIGWVVLAERPGREVVLGAVTKPWEAAPVFRSISGGEFGAFREPGYVKIVWTLRAEPVGEWASVFHTETRVSTTDPETTKRFRRYWSYVAPGVELIRLAMLRPLKKAAERRADAAAA
jgi:hypothetical protein